MKPEIEFQSLRDELREWQGRRFTLLSVSSVFLTAYIGWVVNKAENWTWEIASIPILLIVIGASLLTRHFNRLVVRVSTYLEIFHDFKWQSRLGLFRRLIGPLKTNQLIGIFYGGTVVTAILTFKTLCKAHKNIDSLILFSVLLLFAAISIVAMAFYSSPNQKFLVAWEIAKQKESEAQQKTAAGSLTVR
jgi:hypothetical protein